MTLDGLLAGAPARHDLVVDGSGRFSRPAVTIAGPDFPAKTFTDAADRLYVGTRCAALVLVRHAGSSTLLC